MRLREFRSDGRRGPVAFSLLLSVAALAAVSCTASKASAIPPPTLIISPANGSQGVLPGAAVTVEAKHAKLRDVTVATAAGPVRGYLAANGDMAQRGTACHGHELHGDRDGDWHEQEEGHHLNRLPDADAAANVPGDDHRYWHGPEH